jgi:hypothetical protein
MLMPTKTTVLVWSRMSVAFAAVTALPMELATAKEISLTRVTIVMAYA